MSTACTSPLLSLRVSHRHARIDFGRWLDICTRHKRLTLVSVFTFTALVAILDFYTGDQVPLMIVYLPAIFLVCWIQNIGAGVAMSLTCAVLWLVDDFVLIEDAPQLPHRYWLAVVHFAFFVVVAVMTWRLRLAQEREHLLARTDALTGLLNRQAFVDTAQREIERCRRTQKPLAIAYFDCDNFKTVNDTLGHAAGDELLQAIAETSARQVRKMDCVARLGGDEFACLLPEADVEAAENVVRRVKVKLDERAAQKQWPVSFSIGLVIFGSPPRDVDRLIGAADELMYRVKHHQKNAMLVEFVSH
jgi:diguanylate cyclase (GGDEF)-like protein